MDLPQTTLLKRLWQRWKLIAHKIGDVQARILLSLFYFVVVGPFALIGRLSSDPLRLSHTARPTWLARPAPDTDSVTLARRQF